MTTNNISARRNIFFTNENTYYFLITGLCFSLIFLIIIFILFALPFSEIYLGIKYGDRISCSSKIINIPLKNWLILKGSITLLNIFSLATVFAFTDKTIAYYIIYIINIIFSVYNIAWLITGSIIFWGYCKNLEPENINILMYFSLILGYIGFFNQITFLNKNFENKKKDQKPLLDL